MNFIEKIRTGLKKDFNEIGLQKGEVDSSLSPSNTYRLESTEFWSKDSNVDLTMVEIYHQETNERLFDFLVNESRFFYSWFKVNEIEYLVCAEDILGGQTVIDLTNHQIAGYSPGENGFIWTDFHLSPDSKILATMGCYWACPYVIKLYDFSNPMAVPLREIKEIELLGNDEIILGWLDNCTLKMKGVKRERVREYDANGNFSLKTISEIEIEREITI